jgi:OOP family OmpA-OmpF porin
MNAKKQDESETLAELRQLLLGDELEKLDDISERLEVPENFSSVVGDILPQAMIKSARQGGELSEAMIPTVEEIIRLSIKKDIANFANALFPVIGPAIRKSISETIRQMMQSLNRTLEQSFSWRGLKWRIESMRTGIPISQIALLYGLVYRVEQAFFIHRATGLLLNSIEQPDIHNQDADLVSSMLSAINDFVGDSFKVEANHSLGSIEVGDLSIWIEQGPDSILAVAIRGEAPNSLRTQMQEILESLQLEYSDALGDFAGDVEAFGSSETILEGCMQAQYQDKNQNRQARAKWLIVLGLILFCGWLATQMYQSMKQDAYVEILNNEPGYVITAVTERDGLLVIRGLRDPLAKSANALLALSGLQGDEVLHKFEPYHSLQSDFVEKRVKAILEPPPGVSIDLVEQVLLVKGSASQSWRTRLSAVVPLIGGIVAYDDSALRSNFAVEMLDLPDSVEASFEDGVLFLQGRAEQEWIARLDSQVAKYEELERVDISALINATGEKLVAEINALEAEVIYFDVATSSNLDQMNGDRIVALVSEIVDLSNRLDRSVLIFVNGYSDSVGSFEDNALLSLDRANYVAQFIYLAGISPKYIEVKGLEAPVADEANDAERHQNRRVNFQVIVE